MDETLTHPKIRVALVDDQQLFRSGLAVIIGAQPDMAVVAQAADGTEALGEIAAHGPDVVLMDVQMSPMDGVEATRKIFEDTTGRFGRPPKVIMLTTFDWDEHAATAVRHGASGFLLKDSTPEFVCESIRAVHGGSAVIAPQSLASLLRDEPLPVPAVPVPYLELTEREREVFNAVALGLTNQEISGRLFLSESTVKTHIGAILRKLALRDRVQIVVYSYENGIGR
ncbi:DNA-binding response regulator [Arthrobacter sp. AQ5-05]|uniref:response regulator n=1 Tax=Arthrobacter sp. AQ5-05 TaxID=2184581 RepID=UPI000DCEF096|nr:response regulator transcription factor [Arthrobacter sp. AQ5-05]RAX50085.1 DNA-binding response regulator [Arthrobacter sp. AQ5-05]